MRIPPLRLQLITVNKHKHLTTNGNRTNSREEQRVATQVSYEQTGTRFTEGK